MSICEEAASAGNLRPALATHNGVDGHIEQHPESTAEIGVGPSHAHPAASCYVRGEPHFVP